MNSLTALPYASWPPARKAAAMLFGISGFVILVCAAIYLSGAVFLVLNKVNPAKAHFSSIVRYWQRYGDDPVQRKKLQLAIGVSSLGALVLLPAIVVAAARPRRALHGDARFASASEVKQAGLSQAIPPAIIVGRYRGRVLALGGQRSVMLSAPTRSGKGVGVVIPNLLNWPHSVVVFDIKGENYDLTAGYRARQGQAVYAFSPFDDEGRSHRWNPLASVRADPLHRVGDLLAIGQIFYPNDGGGTSSEGFFNDQARNFFLGLGLLLLESPELPRTVGEMLRQASGKGRSLAEHLNETMARRHEQHKPLSDECMDALRRLTSNSENTQSSIVATFVAPLTIFADVIVDAATSANDFDLMDVRRRLVSIYLRIPPHRLASARPLINLFFSQLVSLNTQHLPSRDPSLRYQCLIVNDEFTAMGRASVITTSAAFLAAYNLRLLTVIQAMSQLDAVYGDKEARTFATNHGLQILFAPREQRDADEYSAMLGFLTERTISRGRSHSFSSHGHSSASQNESEQRRALLMPQEFKELGNERAVIILENSKPILAEKIRYHRDSAFAARILAPPRIAPLKLPLHLARIQERWRWVEEDFEPGAVLDLDALAHDLTQLPATFEGTPEQIAKTLVAFFEDKVAEEAGMAASHSSSATDTGGIVEPVPDEDGVLIACTADAEVKAAHELSRDLAPALPNL